MVRRRARRRNNSRSRSPSPAPTVASSSSSFQASASQGHGAQLQHRRNRARNRRNDTAPPQPRMHPQDREHHRRGDERQREHRGDYRDGRRGDARHGSSRQGDARHADARHADARHADVRQGDGRNGDAQGHSRRDSDRHRVGRDHRGRRRRASEERVSETQPLETRPGEGTREDYPADNRRRRRPRRHSTEDARSEGLADDEVDNAMRDREAAAARERQHRRREERARLHEAERVRARVELAAQEREEAREREQQQLIERLEALEQFSIYASEEQEQSESQVAMAPLNTHVSSVAKMKRSARKRYNQSLPLHSESSYLLQGSTGDEEAKVLMSVGAGEIVQVVTSPSKLCEQLSWPFRFALLVAGFLAFYYCLFYQLRAQGNERANLNGEVQLESIFTDDKTPEGYKRRPPPIWHKELAAFGNAPVASKDDSAPRNYALESAALSAKEAEAERSEKEAEKKKKAAQKTKKPSDSKSSKSSKNAKSDGQSEKQAVSPKISGTSGKETEKAGVQQKSTKKRRRRKKKKTLQGKRDGKASTGKPSTVESSHDMSSSAEKQRGNETSGIEGRSDTASRKGERLPSPKDTPGEAHGLQSTWEEKESRTISSHSQVEKDPTSSLTNQNSTNMHGPTESQGGIYQAIPEAENGAQNDTIPSIAQAPPEVAETAAHDGSGPEPRKPFDNYPPREVQAGHVPVLSWNNNNIAHFSHAEHFFALGGNDHVGTFKPLCVFPETSEIFTPQTPPKCSGYNRTDPWMNHYCSILAEGFDKEGLFERKDVRNDTWLRDEEAAGNVHWVKGLTVLQVYEKSCGNIAHFAGRALMLEHVLENIRSYSGTPESVENVLILPSFHVMKRFLYPHNYAFWHQFFFKAIVSPARYTIGTLGNFLYRSGKEEFSGVPRVQLLHNFSLSGANLPETTIVCFKKVVVPAFLKDRFFVDDMEYPSAKPSMQSTLEDAPRVPRDSLRLRERINMLLYNTSTLGGHRRKLLFLDRDGQRRKISEGDKEVLMKILKDVAAERGFEFSVISFSGMKFDEQVKAVEDAAIAIGVHGANLVNTMFMPPLSVLIELFPFNFHHGMYAEGGGAGVKYFSYQMSTGELYPGKEKYRKVEDCIKLNNKCKIHYRDAELRFQKEDLDHVRKVLDSAFKWYDEVIKTIDESSGERPTLPKTGVRLFRKSAELQDDTRSDTKTSGGSVRSDAHTIGTNPFQFRFRK